MIEKILTGQYDNIKLYHVRMSFSKDMNEIGKASFSKVLHLFSVIFKIYYYRIFKNAPYLYYPPAGPDKVPVLRDIVILLSTRWMFKKIIFHFHAGGLSEMKIESGFFRFLFKLAYERSDCSILLSELNPPDGKNLKSRKTIVLPYGIEDHFKPELVPLKKDITTILFVAIIKESKGILVLLEACKNIKSKGIDFKLDVMGRFESSEFEFVVKEFVRSAGLVTNVSFLGVLSGKMKLAAYANADIFCFPTFFESETFGVVLLEAMQFELPVVATRWRGIPSIIENEKNGFLVEVREINELQEKLELLLLDLPLRKMMGKQGRQIFKSRYTLKEFQKKMEEIFREC